MMASDPGFTWPPLPLPAKAAPEAPARPDPGNEPPPRPQLHALEAPPLSPVRTLLRSVEEVWLGLDTPPLGARMAAAGWSPDAPGVYCARCGSTAGPYESDRTGCSACRERRLPWERLIRLGEYDALLREVVNEVKFTRWRKLGDEIGRMLGRSVAAAMDGAGLDPGRVAVVPVPASFRRRMSRGIDHAMVIARAVAAESGLAILPLLKRRHRPSQLSVPAGERASNVAGSILPRRGVDLAGWTLLVLDDVTTTRATLTAACRAVLACQKLASGGAGGPPPRLWTAVVAVTQLERGRGGPGGGRGRGR